MIKVVNGVIKFGDEIILQNINLSIDKGYTYIIRGENGSGKTTLVNAILGLENRINKSVFSNVDVEAIIYIPDTPFFTDKEKVKRVIKEISYMYEISNFEVNKYLEILNFPQKNDALVGQLSKGTVNKLKIIPLFSDKEVYVLDEIFVGLDSKTQALVLERLKELILKERTILIIEHNVSIVSQIQKYRGVKEILCESKTVKCDNG